MRAVKEAWNAFEEGDGVVYAADGCDGTDEHHGQREKHEQALDEVSHDHGKIASDHGVGEHDGRADHHGQVVVPAKQGREKFADRHEATADIHAEKYEDDQRRDGGDDVAFVMESFGEEVRNGDRVTCHHGVAAQTACDELPVEVGAESQAEGRPQRVGGTGEVGDARQSHEQPAAHIGGFGAQCRQPWTNASTTREILTSGGIGPLGVDEADGEHGHKIDDHRQQHPKIFGNHEFSLLRLLAEFLSNLFLQISVETNFFRISSEKICDCPNVPVEHCDNRIYLIYAPKCRNGSNIVSPRLIGDNASHG